MSQCAAFGCTNSAASGFVMKYFPLNRKRRKEWIAKMGRIKWQPKKNSCICEVHFSPEMWLDNGKKKLRPTALPTIFAHNSESDKNYKNGTNVSSNNESNQKTNKEDEGICDVDIIKSQFLNSQLIEESHFQLSDMSNLCRCCFKVAERNIYQTHFNKESVASILQLCSTKMLEKGDKYPKNICQSCLDELIRCYIFLLKVSTSEAIIHQVVKDTSLRGNEFSEHSYANLINAEEQISTPQSENRINVDVKCELKNEALETIEIHTSNTTVTGHKEMKLESSTKTENEQDSDDDDDDWPDREPTIENIMEHREPRKDGLTKFTCGECGLDFDNNLRLQAHCKKKHYTIPCPLCPEKFSKQIYLDGHMRRHTNQCYYCEKQFSSRTELEKHKEEAHPGPYKFSCSQCDRLFTHGYKLRNHIRFKHLNENAPACQVCGKQFITFSTLKRHMMIHTGERPFVCEQCGKSFNQKSIMQQHIEASHSQTRHICYYCCKSYSLKSHLTYHIRAVHNEGPPLITKRSSSTRGNNKPKQPSTPKPPKPQVCDVCGKVVRNKECLKTHLRKHTGEKPYVCSYCGKAFASQPGLYLHVRSHKNDRRFCCDKCPKRFLTGRHLRDHMLLHDNIKEFVCPYCQRAFTLKGNLTVHIRLHTGETPYVCKVCGKGYRDASNLKRHCKQHQAALPTLKEEKPHEQEASTSTIANADVFFASVNS